MEQTFVLSQGELKIPVVLTEPEDGDIRRLVMGVHGFGGCSRDAIQSSIAEEMDMFYAATVRFDFPAHGESELDDSYLNLSNCLNSLTTVARWIRERYPQVEDLCIFATGFGAYMTLICLEELLKLPGKVKLVVQTPSVMMHETLLAMKHITRPTLEAMGEVTFLGKRNVKVRYSFYEDLQNNVALTTYPIPILILHSESDAYIKLEHIHNFRRINEQSKLVIIPGTSHEFMEDGGWDMVLDLTRDWFEFEQVLVTDWE